MDGSSSLKASRPHQWLYLSGPWYEGDTYISYKYPKALAERWRNYFNNQIIDISQELWKDYHFIGSTDRIYVFGRRPYDSAIRNLEKLGPDCPREFLTGKKPVNSRLGLWNSQLGLWNYTRAGWGDSVLGTFPKTGPLRYFAVKLALQNLTCWRMKSRLP